MYLTYKNLIYNLRILYFKKILRNFSINNQMKMLDYGCGPGDMIVCAKEAGIDVYGIDLFEYSVRLANERGLNIIQGDYKNMPYDRESFDLIFMQSVIEHIPEPVKVVSALKEYLKPNGLFIISAPTPCDNFWDDPTHIRPYTPKSFKVLSELSELSIVKITYVFSFILGLNLKAAWIYKLMNLFPFPLGSNIICVFKK